MESRRPRVLVVDDERHIVDFVTLGLEGRGMEVKGATDGPAALKDLEDFRPDVMVLDLMLPGLSGIEVCRRARARSNVPILILSARDEVKDRVDGLNLGADDYLVKPFAFEELAARVIALLRRGGAPTGRFTLRGPHVRPGHQRDMPKRTPGGPYGPGVCPVAILYGTSPASLHQRPALEIRLGL